MNAPKFMILAIWDADGLALVEILPPNLRVSAKYLCEFAIPHLQASVKTHCPNQSLKGIPFYWDNAPRHRAKVTITKIRELGMNQMSDPPYSPDIAPCDFVLFGDLNHKFQECSYDSAHELLSATTDLMENPDKWVLHRLFDE
jgi:hypothetical protein